MREDADSPATVSTSARMPSILVASDDSAARVRIAKALREALFLVMEATNAQSALDVCLQTPPSLVILDCDMRSPDEIGIAERVVLAKRLPVILMAAQFNDLLVEKAPVAGAMAYVLKAVDAAHLVPTIHTALRRFAEIDQLTAETVKLTASVQQIRSNSIMVGIWMEKFHLSEKDAYARLRLFSRSQSSRISDIAQDLSGRVSELNSIISRI